MAAFHAKKSIFDVVREVFYAAALASSALPSTHTPAPSLALVLVSGGSHFAPSQTLAPPKTSASSKAPTAPKEVPKEPIIVSESQEDKSKEGTRSPTLSVSLIRVIGDIVIRGRAVKCARTSEHMEVGPSPSIDKEKSAVENLSSAFDNELLNAAEVGVDSTPASITEMLCIKVFEGVPNISNPPFLGICLQFGLHH